MGLTSRNSKSLKELGLSVSVVKFSELAPSQLQTWRKILRERADLNNPFNSPDFVRAVDAVRDDVRVALLEQDDAIAGFFPFQSGNGRLANPVGGPLSNSHGLIVTEQVSLDATALLRACGLTRYSFHLLPCSQKVFAAHGHSVLKNLYIDLSSGFEVYEQRRLDSGSRSYRSVLRNQRKLERAYDSVRFEFHTADDNILRTMIDWKRDQCRERSQRDTFAEPWTVDLLKNILNESNEELSAIQSALYLDNRPVAISYDIRCGTIVDTWFPAFDPEFGKLSPGLVCLIERLKVYAAQGVERAYLGREGVAWKSTFASDAVEVAEGAADLSWFRDVFNSGWRKSIDLVKASPLREPAKMLLKYCER